MSEGAKTLIVAAGTGGVALKVAGASTAALSGATVIAATGGAAAVVLVGYGVYKWLSKDGSRSR